ncbi:hypothetical protein EGN72_08155 [Pseudorhodobacter sp. E13]|uniref:hypothetical protein n=1 Tax=Pseudorhodobacter sp. E13 TaxID=2487931 RepID=UPI000F8C97F2|nr:hypothetical protein [Pseudorhodobacter sp. E13]RUS60546.1 hypothetical protein EGN72_08155 [Pseudorhodobacter sp. E13]
MNKPLIAALCATLALGACSTIGKSRLNPFNWFGGSEETVAVLSPTERPADPRLLVSQVTEMQLERMPGGVIIRATGLPPTQGYWDAELVARPVEDGKIVYDFRVFPPLGGAAVSTPQSREVTVAAFLSNIKLDSIRQITVQGETNARTSRR